MKAASSLVARLVNAVSAPLAGALKASEELMAPQIDAGCRPNPDSRRKD